MKETLDLQLRDEGESVDRLAEALGITYSKVFPGAYYQVGRKPGVFKYHPELCELPGGRSRGGRRKGQFKTGEGG